jgi:hypothetical protein
VEHSSRKGVRNVARESADLGFNAQLGAGVNIARMDIQGTAITTKSKWTLSGDGKTLTVSSAISTPMGDMNTTMIYERK